MRRWDADGMADEGDDTPLDYSVLSPDKEQGKELGRSSAVQDINPESFGIRTRNNEVIPKDLDDEVYSILRKANAMEMEGEKASTGLVGSSLSAISGLFKNVVGGKVLTKADLAKPMRGMEEHLLNKNVAKEATVRLCEGVERELIGKKTGSFESESHAKFTSDAC